jgi:tetratricopeptide (TPR) repeat protein
MNNTTEENKKANNSIYSKEPTTFKKKLKDKGVGDRGKVFAKEPTQPPTLFYLHSLLLIGGRLLNKTLTFYNNLISLNDRDQAIIYRNISNQYLDKGFYQKAIETLQAWSRLDPNNPEARYHLALALEKTGKRKQAILVINEVLKLKPQHREAIYLKSKLQLKRKEYKEAIASLESLCAMDPDNADTLYLMGVAYSRLDDLEKAIETLKKTIELNPEVSKYHQYLGLIYERSGKQKEAAKCFSKVMELEEQGEEDDEDDEFD